MTKRQRELIKAEAMRHLALASMCTAYAFRRYHEEVAAALCAALKQEKTREKT